MITVPVDRSLSFRRLLVPLPALLLVCAVAGCATSSDVVRRSAIEPQPAAVAVTEAADTTSEASGSAASQSAKTDRQQTQNPPLQLISLEAPVDEEPEADAVVRTVADTPNSVSDSDLTGDSAASVWTLQQLQDLALSNNPALRQAAAAASQADGIHNQTGLKPNPTLGYFGEEIGNEGAGGLNGAFVSQTFVRGDKLEWNEQVVGHEVQMRRWTAKAQRQRVLTDVRLNFINALAAQQRLELTHAFREVAQQGVTISEQRVAGKFAGRADILQSEMQLSLVNLTIQQTEAQLEAAWQQLAAVSGMPHLTRQPLQGDLADIRGVEDPEMLLQQLISSSPQLAAAQYRVSRAKANLRRQQVQKIPNVTAQVGTGYDDATGDSFANVQLSVPVPAHNKNQGNVHAAWAEYCAATQNVRRLTMKIRHDLAAQIRDYKAAQAAVEQYRDVIIPRAEETLSLMKQAQEGGEYDFLRVLTARRAFFDANIRYVAAQQELASADAIIAGLLLSGGLNQPTTTPLSTGLRDQALNQQ